MGQVAMAIRLAIVGLGKIARDQHIPSIAGTDGIELAAIASRNASIDGIAHFATLDQLLTDSKYADEGTPDIFREARRIAEAMVLREEFNPI